MVKVKLDSDANIAHYEVGKNIRDIIKKQGGTLPEKFPTPDKSLKELEKKNKIERHITNNYDM